MELKSALLTRRSVRKYEEVKVEKEKVDVLLHAAMSGPSACNKKPWEFYVVSNEETLEALKKSTPFSKINAPLAIIVCGNLKKALPGNYKDFWIQDASAASENILLAATDLQLGSLWCGIYPRKQAMQKVSQVLHLEEKIIPLNIIYIGYSAEQTTPRDQYEEKKVHYVK